MALTGADGSAKPLRDDCDGPSLSSPSSDSTLPVTNLLKLEHAESPKDRSSVEKPDFAGIQSNEDAFPVLNRSHAVQEPTSFPQLSNNAPTSPKTSAKRPPSEDEDEEPARARGFQRSASPTSAMQRNKGALYEKVGEEGICKMHRFSLYETTSRYYLVGGDVTDRKFRILKIDRTADTGDLIVSEDEIVYTKKEMNQLLNAVDDGNRGSGGLRLKCSTWGLLGFIRFTGAYYT